MQPRPARPPSPTPSWVWRRDHVISLINPKNLPSIRVVERIGERLEGRIEHFGRQYLLYGLDRATYLAEVAPVGLRRAG